MLSIRFPATETLVKGRKTCDKRSTALLQAPPPTAPEDGTDDDHRTSRTTGSSAPIVAGKGLKLGAIGLLSSIVIGVASTAPGYSLAAVLGGVATEVGDKAPVIMLIAFIPILFISYAYKSLNAQTPDCGTNFTWAAKAFGPRTGWLSGWALDRRRRDRDGLAGRDRRRCTRSPVRHRRPGRERRRGRDRWASPGSSA